jgi:hypothetical protein
MPPRVLRSCGLRIRLGDRRRLRCYPFFRSGATTQKGSRWPSDSNSRSATVLKLGACLDTAMIDDAGSTGGDRHHVE